MNKEETIMSETKNVDVTYATEKENIDLIFLKEHLSHARHLETERMMFNSIFSIFIATAMLGVFQINDICLKLSVLIFLAIIAVIAILLTARWNFYFAKHYSKAKKLAEDTFKYNDYFESNSCKKVTYTKVCFIVFDAVILLGIVIFIFAICFQNAMY